MRGLGMEIKRVEKTGAESATSAEGIGTELSKLNGIVDKIADKSTEIEKNVNTALLRQTTEIQVDLGI